MLCILTVHGIGFQQAPSADGKVRGYADNLQDNLRRVLHDELGDDPLRSEGPSGPVYVQSNWPPFEGTREEGLRRLGTWVDDDQTNLTSETALAPGPSRFCHVALVYCGLEEAGWDPPTLAPMGALALPSALRYASVGGMANMVLQDIEGLLHHQPTKVSGSPSLRVRRDRPNDEPRVRPDQPAPAELVASMPTSGVADVIKQVEDDVGAYIARDRLRQRARGFVAEAISRLCTRDDIQAVVVNAHSNGTVIALDAIRLVSPNRAEKVRAFVTAGSPLRKYVRLFDWDTSVEQLPRTTRWLNFFDERDPVADRLDPGGTWRRGDSVPDPVTEHLFEAVGWSGTVAPVAVTDIQVHNLEHSSGGGLQAHNYWDNTDEFVRELAKLLRVV